MEPEQVIRSVDNGPYAVGTIPGWTVNGPLRDNNCELTGDGKYITANRISVAKLDELWNQQFKYDFPESNQEQLEMSQEDPQFMDSVSQSARLVYR